MEAAIAWFNDHKGKVTYSMAFRRGPNPAGGESYDCSSAIYYSLIQAGIFPSTINIGNTDSLFNDLPRHGFHLVPADKAGNVATKRGDIFIWGIKGQSTGGAGHTGIFINENDIIHCNYGYNGITINNHDQIAGWNGWPNLTVFRYGGTAVVSVQNSSDQIVEIGSFIRFDQQYLANDVQFQANTWQVRSDTLCPADFSWEDNGIPAALLYEVDRDGYATDDQELAVGSLYKIPGKFLVLDIGQSGTHWMAQVGFGAMTFWVDIETATEVGSNDAGTPVPGKKLIPPSVTPATPTAPATPPKDVVVIPTPAPAPVTVPATPAPAPQPVGDKGYTDEDRARDKEILSLVQQIKKLLSSVWGSLTSLHKKLKK